MDQYHHHHHHNHNHHHQQQRHINPEFVESRYFSLRPPPPPPPRPFPDDHTLFPRHPRPPHPPPHRHLPPPPQTPLPPPPPPPPIPCILHQSPPSISSHKHLNFVNFPPHHHPHHYQHRRQLPVDDEGLDRSNRGVVYDRRCDEDYRHRYYFPESPRVSPIDARPMPNSNGLDWDRHAHVHRPVNLDRVSPPPIREIDDRFRFREDLNVEHRLRLHPDKFQDRRDDRRIMGNVERDDRRIMGNVERDDRRIMGNVERDDQRIMGNLERDDRMIMGNLMRDDHLHEQYHPEVLLRDFELNSGSNECVRRPMVDEVPIRGCRDDVMVDENVNFRRGGVHPPPRDVSRSPVKFRNRGIDVDDGFYEEGMNFGSELGRYADKGRREEMQDYSRIPRKNSQKKSAFLRIHPLIQSSSRNRCNTTPSPQKGKESLELLDHRLSQERDRSPVELDVSFKSNALVAKAIMGTPSSSPVHHNKSLAVGDLNIGKDSESPLKAECVKNCATNSNVSKKEEKHSGNRVRTSPIMKRVGRPRQVEERGSNSGSVSSGSSSLSGGTNCRGSPKGQISFKGDTSVHPDKVSSLSVRKKRKSIISRSPLSGSVPTKTDAKLVNMDNSVNQPSDSCNSDKCIKNSEEELSSGGQVIGQIENEIIEDTGKVDVSESIGHSVSEASFPKRVRKRGRLVFLPDSPIPTSERPENANRCAKEEQRASNFEKNVTKSVNKCSSNSCTEYGSSKDQDMMPVLVDNGSGEGTPESLASLGGNMNSIDIHHGNVDKHDPIAVASSTSSPVDVSNIVQDRVDLTCTVDKVDKSCENQVILSTEKGTGEQLCENVHMGIIDNNQAELRYSGDSANVVNFSNIDKTSAAFNEDVDTDKLIRISDISATNDIQVQECQGAGTIVVDEVRGESPKAIDSLGCDLTLFTVEPDILLNRKRKVRSQLDSLDSEISETSLDNTVAGSVPVKDSDIPVEKMNSSVSGSSSSCFITESDVLLANELMDSRLDSISSMNHGCDSDRIEYYSSCSKKQKIHPFESVSSDALIYENDDFPASADTLISMVEVPFDLVKYSTQSAERIVLYNSVVPDMNIVGGSTSSLSTTNCSFADSSKADLVCEHPYLSVKENTHPDIKQSSSLSEAGCKQKEDVNLLTSDAGSGSGLIAFESEGRIATIHQNACGGCIGADGFSDSDHGLLDTNMACETNIIVNGILPSLSDCPQLGAECTCDEVDTNSDMLDSLPNVDSSRAGCLDTPMLDISDTVPAANVMSEEEQGMDDRGPSEHSVMQGSLFSHSNSHLESKDMNLKPEVSAQKTILVPSKNAKNTVSISNAMSRRVIRRNVLTRADASLSSGCASSVIASSKRAPSTYTAKPRTWLRTDNPPASNILVKKPFVGAPPPKRPPVNKTVKVPSTSYIRKGNSLVRHPASGVETLGPRVFGASINQSKPNDTNKFSKMGSSGLIDSTVVHDCVVTGGQNTPIEMPKTPPLPCSGKESNCDINSGDCGSSQQVGQYVGMNNEEVFKSSEIALNSSRIPGNVQDKNLEDTGSLSDGNVSASNSKRIVYIKRKSYQLIAAKNPPQPCVARVDKGPALSSDNSYFKRRKNQLIRASSESNIQQMVGAIDDGSNLQPQRAPDVYSGRSSAKRQSNRAKPPKVSLVWKLGDRKSSCKGDLLRCGKILSHLLPWKRATYWRSVWRSSASVSNSSSLMKSRKSHSSRKRAMVYVRSGLGFSLRRSKVISIAGSSLKWSKSMEKHSKKVNEEAAAAAAVMDTVGQRTGASVGISGAKSRNHSSHKPVHSLKQHPGERIFRIGVFRYRMDPSRRTLQRISDEEPSDSAASNPGKDARKPYVPKRLLIGSDEYVRIGNGNQLVRDPKRRTRVLANEKVRWSLHTARMRLAKKRKFCQFFTRFGKCNKGEGKCPFIHDPSKIAVCTKFLNGLCGDPNCKLTHKVIPERMPDCSFFLQGLCSNENCPYRHVNVNPKASICESFRRGYCAEGNECRKKHSYICPDFEATGSCPQGSRCKLYHPKKGKPQKHKISKDQNSRGRYFGSGLTVFAETETSMAEKHVAPKKDHLPFQGGDLGDYMNLDVSDDETEDNVGLMMIMSEPMIISEGDSLSCQLDDLDELIKPLRLLERN